MSLGCESLGCSRRAIDAIGDCIGWTGGLMLGSWVGLMQWVGVEEGFQGGRRDVKQMRCGLVVLQ